MSEWWTYRLSSFLLFSARTYRRLVESYNGDVWPLQVLCLAIGLGMLIALRRKQWPLRDRAVFVLLGAAWCSVAWSFEYSRFAAINWAADYTAVMFALQAAALLWVGAMRGGLAFRRKRAPTDLIAFVLVVVGLLYPLIGASLGRPWAQAEVFGLMPDPTVIVTLGFVLLADPMPRWLIAIPLASCVFSGAMLAALRAGDAWVVPTVAVVALACALWRRRRPLHRH